MQAPERIWAWHFAPDRQDDVMQGGWTDTQDKRETEYIRADHATLLQAALEVVRDAGYDV